MIKNFEQFLNESVKRYPNADNDYFEEYIKLSEDCMLANIEFVKQRGGHVYFKEPIKLRVYDEGGYHDKYTKIRKENVVSIYVDNDVKKAEEMLGDELGDKNENGEYLVAVTEDNENIVLDRSRTILWDCVFDINSNFEYVDYKHSKEINPKYND
jgi:hypothetical protein